MFIISKKILFSFVVNKNKHHNFEWEKGANLFLKLQTFELDGRFK